jgi:hypothetical protein
VYLCSVHPRNLRRSRPWLCPLQSHRGRWRGRHRHRLRHGTAADFADYCERAETRAIGRALAALGIGTQFVGQDLTEGEHVADAPVHMTTAQPSNGRDHAEPVTDVVTTVTASNGDAPPPLMVPEASGLPCAGVFISALKPAQLAMLISKTARLVSDGADQWVPLLHTLQSERAARLDRGRKPTGEG